MAATIWSERGCTGSRSTRWFQWLERGNSGHLGAPGSGLAGASAAAPTASSAAGGGIGGMRATRPMETTRKRETLGRGAAPGVRLALRQTAVAAHVAVLAAHRQVDGRLVPHVLDLAHGHGVDAGHPSRPQDVARAVTEAHLDAPAVHEVELFLL